MFYAPKDAVAFTVSGDLTKNNVKPRFDPSYMRMAADNKL
jgi:hypothetical protein